MSADRRLVFLHGFTQTHHHWHDVAYRVADRLRRTDAPASLAFIDLPGHGLASEDDTPITEAGAPLAELAGRGTYIGYSMGGRFALHAAIAAPDVVERLVLIGATPGIEEDAGRAARRELDEARGREVERAGVATFVDDWLASPMFASLPRDRAGIEHRTRNTVAGLASACRRSGTGSQLPLWDAIADLRMPTLVLAGSLDRKFVAIGRRMADRMPNATFESVPDAGHAAPAERPDVVADSITAFVRS